MQSEKTQCLQTGGSSFEALGQGVLMVLYDIRYTQVVFKINLLSSVRHKYGIYQSHHSKATILLLTLPIKVTGALTVFMTG